MAKGVEKSCETEIFFRGPIIYGNIALFWTWSWPFTIAY
jgi:hypothetical protein